MPTNLRSVVFICTGNFYRSRFSEYLFNALATKSGLQWRATSRGLRTWTVGAHEGPLSEFAAYRLTALGVPFDRVRFPIQLSETRPCRRRSRRCPQEGRTPRHDGGAISRVGEPNYLLEC